MIDDNIADDCKRCGCCTAFWRDCEECGGEGGRGSACIDDMCHGQDDCIHGDLDLIPCDTCEGRGGWYECDCCEHGTHKSKPGPCQARCWPSLNESLSEPSTKDKK